MLNSKQYRSLGFRRYGCHILGDLFDRICDGVHQLILYINAHFCRLLRIHIQYTCNGNRLIVIACTHIIEGHGSRHSSNHYNRVLTVISIRDSDTQIGITSSLELEKHLASSQDRKFNMLHSVRSTQRSGNVERSRHRLHHVTSLIHNQILSTHLIHSARTQRSIRNIDHQTVRV